jgi:hypothetical protein
VELSGGGSVQADVSLPGITPIPASAGLLPSRQSSAGVPLIHWRQETRLTIQDCTGGSAIYDVLQNGSVLAEGTLVEGPAGQYSANLASLHPASGYAQVSVDLTCPDVAITHIEPFDIYVDPSGTVKDVVGQPIENAQVTLFAYDPVTMSLVQVSEGDARLSPANRANPDLTDAAGHFGWDASAGAYVIRAEKEGCISASNPNLAHVQTGLVQSPADVVDLELRLQCAGDTETVFAPLVIR